MNENEFKPTTDPGRGITSLWRTLFYNAIRLLKRWSIRQEPSLPIQALILGEMYFSSYVCTMRGLFFRAISECDRIYRSSSSVQCTLSLKSGKKLNVFGNFCVELSPPVQGILFCPWPTDADTVLLSKLAIEERKGRESEASKSVVDHHSSLNRNLY